MVLFLFLCVVKNIIIIFRLNLNYHIIIYYFILKYVYIYRCIYGIGPTIGSDSQDDVA